MLSYADEPIVVDFGFANQWSMGASKEGTAAAAAQSDSNTVAPGKTEKDGDSEKAFMTNLSWGTPEYLAPERAIQSEHDERLSDIW